jgi:ribose 5-phosphate isomerase A
VATTPTAQDRLKMQAGVAAADLVQDGQIVGLGTGSTTEWAIRRLGERVARDRLDILGIPTSERSERLANDLKIPLTTLEEHSLIDITIDGADEVDPALDLVKGGGGALTREKIIAAASEREVIVVDEGKLVEILGKAFALPVEVVPMAVPTVRAELATLGAEIIRRTTHTGPVKTDNGMAILDCRFPSGIRDKHRIEREINMIPGVLENGLFLGLASEVLVGTPNGVRRLEPGDSHD